MSWETWIVAILVLGFVGAWVPWRHIFPRQTDDDWINLPALPDLPFPFRDVGEVMESVCETTRLDPDLCTHQKVWVSTGLPCTILCVTCGESSQLPITWCSLVRVNHATGARAYDVFPVHDPTHRFRVYTPQPGVIRINITP